MQSYFNELSGSIQQHLRGEEVFTASFNSEDSDFVRFNQGEVRQAGNVTQSSMSVELIRGRRHARAEVTLSRSLDGDRRRLRAVVEKLRDLLPHLPEDPHLLYSTEVRSSERTAPNELPAPGAALGSILDATRSQDLVGVYASGGIHCGFANSLGQRNWSSTHTFHLDWCLYHQQDKAVKSSYAGFRWDNDALAERMHSASEKLAILKRSPRTIDPGQYRVFLSPAAVYDLLATIAWGGFGLKDHRTKQTSLLKMVEEGKQLHSGLTLVEDTEHGVAPDFQGAGFIKPPRVPLIEGGCFRNCLASPRSAKEFGVATNGASDDEMPKSISLAPGALPSAEALDRLDNGLYIGNLHYLNYSDRPACRITGMTRFATFWVEGGRIVEPVNVMRFDESIYRILGDNLVDLTQEQEMIFDPGTYGRRSTQTGRLPGALIDDFTFTL